MSSASRATLLEAEVKRLENELKIIQTQWNKRHFLFGFVVLSIPAYFLFGKVYAVIGVLCTPVPRLQVVTEFCAFWSASVG